MESWIQDSSVFDKNGNTFIGSMVADGVDAFEYVADSVSSVRVSSLPLWMRSSSPKRATPVTLVLTTGMDLERLAKSMARIFLFIVRLKSISDSLASTP